MSKMSAAEWFRKKTWTQADQEDFFAHLGRSRGQFHKAQYLRIQAFELQKVGVEELLTAALQLLEKLFVEYPCESQVVQARDQQGDCLGRLGKFDEALAAYRKAMEIERQKGGIKTSAYRGFAWLVATRPVPQLYDEALAVLDEFGKHEMFPSEQYESSISRALIYKAKSRFDLAKSWAQAAVSAASKDSSGLRYHSKLGLVPNPEKVIYEEMKELSA
jgi:tetratricopeptide (TPR) repeat protein